MPLDEDAVAALYREHGPLVRRIALRATGDAQIAEDLVQEVVLRVWRQAPQTDNLRGYVAQATRNLIVDRYRAAGRRPAEAGELNPAGPAAAGAVDEVDRALDGILVEAALARLSREHLAVIRLLHYRRLTVAEAATALGIPAGTVKSRAFYALRQLRVVLDEMGVSR